MDKSKLFLFETISDPDPPTQKNKTNDFQISQEEYTVSSWIGQPVRMEHNLLPVGRYYAQVKDPKSTAIYMRGMVDDTNGGWITRGAIDRGMRSTSLGHTPMALNERLAPRHTENGKFQDLIVPVEGSIVLEPARKGARITNYTPTPFSKFVVEKKSTTNKNLSENRMKSSVPSLVDSNFSSSSTSPTTFFSSPSNFSLPSSSSVFSSSNTMSNTDTSANTNNNMNIDGATPSSASSSSSSTPAAVDPVNIANEFQNIVKSIAEKDPKQANTIQSVTASLVHDKSDLMAKNKALEEKVRQLEIQSASQSSSSSTSSSSNTSSAPAPVQQQQPQATPQQPSSSSSTPADPNLSRNINHALGGSIAMLLGAMKDGTTGKINEEYTKPIEELSNQAPGLASGLIQPLMMASALSQQKDLQISQLTFRLAQMEQMNQQNQKQQQQQQQTGNDFGADLANALSGSSYATRFNTTPIVPSQMASALKQQSSSHAQQQQQQPSSSPAQPQAPVLHTGFGGFTLDYNQLASSLNTYTRPVSLADIKASATYGTSNGSHQQESNKRSRTDMESYPSSSSSYSNSDSNYTPAPLMALHGSDATLAMLTEGIRHYKSDPSKLVYMGGQ